MRKLLLAGVILIGILAGFGGGASACGGLFCQNLPVNQQVERIIFTVNGNNTITAYVQINYTGSAPDFSWVVPVPSVPELDVAEQASFDELDTLTAPVFIPPPVPDCAMVVFEMSVSSSDDGAGQGVDVLASGAVGPYNYDVITSPDPNALITWLRTNNYQVTEQMEPLIRVYNAEGMVFLAMKLQPEQGVQDIQPIVMTYESVHPMIPLRLTAVAAVPDMGVLTWIFADQQMKPTNYAHPEIQDEDIRFDYMTNQNNYLLLLDQTVDLYDGRAFITEYAQPTNVMLQTSLPADELVRKLFAEYKYVTRFFGRISPEEMTVDPTFDVDNDLPNVNNIHDLTDLDPEKVWACEGIDVQIEYDPTAVPPGFK